MRSSLSLSLSIGEERNRLELERNSPPTKNALENFGKKKADLKKRVPFSLSLSSSLSFKGGEKE